MERKTPQTEDIDDLYKQASVAFTECYSQMFHDLVIAHLQDFCEGRITARQYKAIISEANNKINAALNAKNNG
jgi:hypothetical protein